jgi:hypothetical protein
VAGLFGAIVFTCLIAFAVCQCSSKGTVLEEKITLQAFRISALRVFIGVVALLTSYMFLPAILTMAGGSVSVATMPDFKTAKAISRGRASACSRPLHGASLAVASIVFSVLQVVSSVLIHIFVLAPLLYRVYDYNYNFSYYSCSYFFGESYAAYM